MNSILQGECFEILKTLPNESVDCVITSPPYWALRDYGVDSQLGLEKSFEEYISKLCDIFNEIKRVLKKEGTVFVNLGDTYYGGGRNRGNKNPHPKGVRRLGAKSVMTSSPIGQDKCLAQIPSRFAIEMCRRGWILRNEIIWHKPNAMPSSAKDRFTVDFEKVFFFVKSKRYKFETQIEAATGYDGRKDIEYHGGKKDIAVKKHRRWRKNDGTAIEDPYIRNKRCVWSINTKSFSEAHFATFPEALIDPMIKAGCPIDGIVLDPFMGAGTTAVVASKLNRKWIGIELNHEYIKIAEKRINSLTKPLW